MKNKEKLKKKNFFLNPSKETMQRRYEALRYSYIEGLSDKEVAEKFGYTLYSFRSIKRDFKDLHSDDFFKELKRGPKKPYKDTVKALDLIVKLRQESLSIYEIQKKLKEEGIKLSAGHISKLLKDSGFNKLNRRRNF